MIWDILPTDTASGSIASFPDGADNVPVEALSVALEPVQDLHGQSAPYPAGGGKNKLPPIASATKSGVTVEATEDGEIWIHGTPTISSGHINFPNLATTPTSLDGNTVAVSVNEKTVGVGFVLGSANGSLNLTLSDTVTTKTGTYTAGNHLFEINVRYDVGTINKKYKVQLELGSTATAWSPYENICPITGHEAVNIWREATYDTTANPQITIPLGSTIYGGSLDVLTGVLTVDRAMVDLGSLTWSYHSSGFFYNNKLPIKSGTQNCICSTYQRGNSDGATRYFTINQNIIRVYDSTYSGDVNAFKTAVTGQQLVYELATPIEIQLTAHELTTLLGTNNIWADTGDTDVTYRADIGLYIAKVISEALT